MFINDVSLFSEIARLKAQQAEAEAALAESRDAQERLEKMVRQTQREKFEFPLQERTRSSRARMCAPKKWAMLASLVAICKLNGVNPFNYIYETLRAIFDGHARNQIEQLMPWTCHQASNLAA